MVSGALPLSAPGGHFPRMMPSYFPDLPSISLVGAASAALAASPWVAAPLVLAARLRTTPSLDDIDVAASANAACSTSVTLRANPTRCGWQW